MPDLNDVSPQASGVAAPDSYGIAAEMPETSAVTAAGMWHRVSPRQVVVELVSSILVGVILVAAVVVIGSLVHWEWTFLAAALLGLLVLVVAFFAPRRVRSIGYQLRNDDLLFRRGIMFHRQVAVPYGRMQLVDLQRGPIARALGLVELRMITAAAATSVNLPGLPEAAAEELRDTLVALAESRRAGL